MSAAASALASLLLLCELAPAIRRLDLSLSQRKTLTPRVVARRGVEAVGRGHVSVLSAVHVHAEGATFCCSTVL